MLETSKRAKQFLGAKTSTMMIRVDNSVVVLVALIVFVALTALTVFAALTVLIALTVSVALIVFSVAAVAVDYKSISYKKHLSKGRRDCPYISFCRGFSRALKVKT